MPNLLGTIVHGVKENSFSVLEALANINGCFSIHYIPVKIHPSIDVGHDWLRFSFKTVILFKVTDHPRDKFVTLEFLLVRDKIKITYSKTK